MALDIQTIAMTNVYVPYERPPQPMTLWSAIPRGLQSFIVDSQLLDVKILNDEAFLVLQATLPPNFAYVLADVNFHIRQNLAVNWDPVSSFSLQNFFRAPLNLSVGLSGKWIQNFTGTDQDDGGRALVQIQPFPSFPMIGSPGTSGILMEMTAWNNVAAATTAGTVNAFVSFWQFDLEQVRKYPINSPQPVHSR